jgi:hypothetical protein
MTLRQMAIFVLAALGAVALGLVIEFWRLMSL